MGDGYPTQVIHNLKKPFWIDILLGWSEVFRRIKPENLTQILHSPIWFNSEFHHGQNLFIKNWFEKGVKNVIDLLDDNGFFLDFDVFKVRFSVQGTFLHYQSILNRIPIEWRHKINDNRNLYVEIKYSVPCLEITRILLKDAKGSRRLYNILTDTDAITPTRWATDLGNIPEEDLRKYNSVITELHDVKLKDFQFKINNKILVTKSFLHRINKVDNNTCTFCNREIETIKHLFCECETVKEFWNSLNNWLQRHANLRLNLEEKTIIFSWQKKNSFMNFLLVLAKSYIYKTKFTTGNLSLVQFKLVLKRKFETEKYISKINHRYDKFLGKWSSLYNFLNEA